MFSQFFNFTGRAFGNLGLSQESLGEYDKAIALQEHHLSIAAQIGDKCAKILAHSSLGKKLSSVMSGIYKICLTAAVHYLMIWVISHLLSEISVNSNFMTFYIHSFLGRIHYSIGNFKQAVQYLQQGLSIAEQIGHKEDEAKIRHRLGLALWGHGEMEDAQQQLYRY